MLPKIITISGLSGSGKSTLAKLLAEKLKYQRIYFGGIMRDLAKKHKMSVEGFDAYCKNHPKIHLDLDRSIINYAKQNKKRILEGRLAGWMLHNENIPAYKIWVSLPKLERAKRTAERDGQSISKAYKIISLREKTLVKTYKDIYKLNFLDTSIYDYILKANKSPEKLAFEIIKVLKKAKF